MTTLTHTMIRITEPARSLAFYRDRLGMALVAQFDFPEWQFSLYFLQPDGNGAPASTPEEVFSRPGLLELTHNWGSEGRQMHDGNTDPQGYGHICLAVDDIAAACAEWEAEGVAFHKRLGEGGMKDVAFIIDPDGYRIEVVQPTLMGFLDRYRIQSS